MSPRQLLRHRRLLILSAVNLLQLGFLTRLWTAPLSLPPPEPLPDKDSAWLSTPLPQMPKDSVSADSLYATLTGQPVFHEDRHFVPEAATEKAVDTPPPAYVLSGYMELPGRPGRAYLQAQAGGRAIAVSVGDHVDDWTVTEINARRVSLRSGERVCVVGKGGAEDSPPTTSVVTASAVPASTVVSAPPASTPDSNRPTPPVMPTKAVAGKRRLPDTDSITGPGAGSAPHPVAGSDEFGHFKPIPFDARHPLPLPAGAPYVDSLPAPAPKHAFPSAVPAVAMPAVSLKVP